MLLAPEHTPLLMDRFGREMAPSFELASQDPDAANRFPNLARAAELAMEVYQVTCSLFFQGIRRISLSGIHRQALGLSHPTSPKCEGMLPHKASWAQHMGGSGDHLLRWM